MIRYLDPDTELDMGSIHQAVPGFYVKGNWLTRLGMGQYHRKVVNYVWPN